MRVIYLSSFYQTDTTRLCVYMCIFNAQQEKTMKNTRFFGSFWRVKKNVSCAAFLEEKNLSSHRLGRFAKRIASIDLNHDQPAVKREGCYIMILVSAPGIFYDLKLSYSALRIVTANDGVFGIFKLK